MSFSYSLTWRVKQICTARVVVQCFYRERGQAIPSLRSEHSIADFSDLSERQRKASTTVSSIRHFAWLLTSWQQKRIKCCWKDQRCSCDLVSYRRPGSLGTRSRAYRWSSVLTIQCVPLKTDGFEPLPFAINVLLNFRGLRLVGYWG
jgi:hypothetical protein